jgi:hypothetical protein
MRGRLPANRPGQKPNFPPPLLPAWQNFAEVIIPQFAGWVENDDAASLVRVQASNRGIDRLPVGCSRNAVGIPRRLQITGRSCFHGADRMVHFFPRGDYLWRGNFWSHVHDF